MFWHKSVPPTFSIFNLTHFYNYFTFSFYNLHIFFDFYISLLLFVHRQKLLRPLKVYCNKTRRSRFYEPRRSTVDVFAFRLKLYVLTSVFFFFLGEDPHGHQAFSIYYYQLKSSECSPTFQQTKSFGRFDVGVKRTPEVFFEPIEIRRRRAGRSRIRRATECMLEFRVSDLRTATAFP